MFFEATGFRIVLVNQGAVSLLSQTSLFEVIAPEHPDG
jgi:hypothetical protein